MFPLWNWVKLKIIDDLFKLFIKKKQDSATSEESKNVYPTVFVSLFLVSIYVKYFFDAVRNQT